MNLLACCNGACESRDFDVSKKKKDKKQCCDVADLYCTHLMFVCKNTQNKDVMSQTLVFLIVPWLAVAHWQNIVNHIASHGRKAL